MWSIQLLHNSLGGCFHVAKEHNVPSRTETIPYQLTVNAVKQRPRSTARWWFYTQQSVHSKNGFLFTDSVSSTQTERFRWLHIPLTVFTSLDFQKNYVLHWTGEGLLTVHDRMSTFSGPCNELLKEVIDCNNTCSYALGGEKQFVSRGTQHTIRGRSFCVWQLTLLNAWKDRLERLKDNPDASTEDCNGPAVFTMPKENWSR